MVKIYSSNNSNQALIIKQMLEENRLRSVIRSLIKEVSADVPDEQPQRATGINVLEDTLKVIIPIIEDAYKGLTTSKSQRDSFRAHIIHAVKDSLAPVSANEKAGEELSQIEFKSIYIFCPRNNLESIKRKCCFRQRSSKTLWSMEINALGRWQSNKTSKAINRS